MQQHAIPQNVTSFQFKLIGDMTLKQFGELAGGILVAYIILQSPLLGILKWPLVFIFGFGGFALAFMPIEDRPLDRWLLSFFKSIYSPTLYLYKKGSKAIEENDIILTSQAPIVQQPEEPLLIPEEIPVVAPPVINEITAQTDILPSTPAPAPIAQEEQQIIQDIPKIIEEEPPTPTAEPVTCSQTLYTNPTAETQTAVLPSMARPNIVNGTVLGTDGRQIEGVLILVKDQFGFPVRALKTNRLGQFGAATPLNNGVYSVEIEKEGLQFDTVSIELGGEVVPNIQIKAKGA